MLLCLCPVGFLSLAFLSDLILIIDTKDLVFLPLCILWVRAEGLKDVEGGSLEETKAIVDSFGDWQKMQYFHSAVTAARNRVSSLFWDLV